MTFIDLPEDKQDDIRDYFSKTQSTKEFQEKYNILLDKLP